MSTCGMRFETYTTNATAIFEELSILASFPTPTLETDLDADDSAIFPVAMKSSIMPLEPEAYSYDVITAGNLTYFNFTLNNFDEELFSFAVWGRVFATDGQEADPPLIDAETDASQGTTIEPTTGTTPDAAFNPSLSSVLMIPVFALVLRCY